jgi:hypothetical protein
VSADTPFALAEAMLALKRDFIVTVVTIVIIDT